MQHDARIALFYLPKQACVQTAVWLTLSKPAAAAECAALLVAELRAQMCRAPRAFDPSWERDSGGYSLRRWRRRGLAGAEWIEVGRGRECLCGVD